VTRTVGLSLISAPSPITISVVVPVYRDATRAIAAVAALRTQQLPAGASLQIVVVDDGSDDGTADRIDNAFGNSVDLVRLGINRGRSAARNAGASWALGEVLLFMDCDCTPQGDHFLLRHVQSLSSAIASTGPVFGQGGNFWDSYQRRSSDRRERAFRRGETYAGSTQNMAVRRSSFHAVGGFDEAYSSYGFEDRDLLLRLSREGSIVWTPSALVHHLDALSLPEVCQKMRLAGNKNSSLFLASHPQAYRRLGYSAIDGELHPLRGLLFRIVAPLLPGLARASNPALESHWLPLALRMAWVTLLSAASFGAGTLLRRS
jgi:glycosyltransferase involved in cell wall biosynthesis